MTCSGLPRQKHAYQKRGAEPRGSRRKKRGGSRRTCGGRRRERRQIERRPDIKRRNDGSGRSPIRELRRLQRFLEHPGTQGVDGGVRAADAHFRAPSVAWLHTDGMQVQTCPVLRVARRESGCGSPARRQFPSLGNLPEVARPAVRRSRVKRSKRSISTWTQVSEFHPLLQYFSSPCNTQQSPAAGSAPAQRFAASGVPQRGLVPRPRIVCTWHSYHPQVFPSRSTGRCFHRARGSMTHPHILHTLRVGIQDE